MRIMITGSEGYIGKHLQYYFKDFVGIDRKTGKNVQDITEKDLEGIECVIHLAAQTSVWNTDYQQIIEDNIKAFTHIFFLCKHLNIKFIYASSSCSVNATSLYGISKRYDEMLSATYNYGVGVRFHNVYGGAGRENTLYGICLNNKEVKLWNKGLNVRHFTYIDDICRGIIAAMTLPSGVYNICNPQQNTTLQFCQEIQKHKPLDIILLPEKRNLDKETQLVENIPNILEDFVSIEAGIRMSLN